MNILVIVLAVVVVLLIYYIYSIFNAPFSIASKVDLAQPPMIIPSTSISSPYSTSYTVCTWVYIYHYTPQINRFLMYGDGTYNGSNSLFSLRMDTKSSDMYCDILVNDSNAQNYSVQSIPLNAPQESFPLQKWVFVSVSVSPNFIECYINGKFISASGFSGTGGAFRASAPVNSASSATFTFGAKGVADDSGALRQNGSPVVLANLARYNYPMSAGDIYDLYNKGNGQQSSIWGPAYHMDLNISRDKDTYTLPIF